MIEKIDKLSRGEFIEFIKRLIINSEQYKRNNESDSYVIALDSALFYDLCKHGKWHKIQNGNRAGKSQGGLLPIIAY